MEENKPVLIGGAWAAALLSLAEAILALGQTSGWWGLSTEETQGWLTVFRIALPMLVVGAATWWTARRTTSLEKPTDVDGVRLKRSDNETAKLETRKIERELLKK